MLARLRGALLLLFLPWLVTWAADALELLRDDDEAMDSLDPWQREHVYEASAATARAWDCMEYVAGRGRRVENLPCPE